MHRQHVLGRQLSNALTLSPLLIASKKIKTVRATMGKATFDSTHLAPPPAYAPNQNTNRPSDTDPQLYLSYQEATHTTYHAHQSSRYDASAIGSEIGAADPTKRALSNGYGRRQILAILVYTCLPFVVIPIGGSVVPAVLRRQEWDGGRAVRTKDGDRSLAATIICALDALVARVL